MPICVWPRYAATQGHSSLVDTLPLSASCRMAESSHNDPPPTVWASLRRMGHEVFNDHAMMIAAGLAYYAVFGLLPAIAAAAALWGQFGDTGALQRVLQHSGAVLPPAMAQVLEQFTTSVPDAFGGGVALLVNVAAAIWTAFWAARGVITALNIVYDVKETRSQLRRIVVALTVGVGGIFLLFAAIGLLALAPLVSEWVADRTALQLFWLRWPVMMALFAVGLALLFRYGPDRAQSSVMPLLWGTGSAALLCLGAFACISLYVANVASFGRFYGSLAGIAVVLLWLYAVALSLLLGAEIDAVLSGQPAKPAGPAGAQPTA